MITIALSVGAAGAGMLLVSAFLRRRARSAPGRSVDSAALTEEVLSRLHESGEVAAVQLYRRRTGSGLREARDLVERISRDRP